MSASTSLSERRVIGGRVDATSYADAADRVLAWARAGESRYVCVANTHMLVEARSNAAFGRILECADLVTPDGMPLVWALRLLGVPDASRVYGPTLTLHVCAAAEAAGIPIALYGGTEDSLRAFVDFLGRNYPRLEVACQIAPPFRPLTPEEDAAYTREIAASGARIVFVGIGCPKQERWMAAHRGRIPAVMLGVGAAFDFHSGRVRQAPAWVQRAGLEWLFRLAMEPRRLWRRYGRVVPRFTASFALQYVRHLGCGLRGASAPETA